MADTETDTTPMTPPPAPAVPVDSTDVHVVVDGISADAAAELRSHIEQSTGGGNRFVWFLFGFFAAILAGAVASIAFLAVSNDDDDGEIDLEVPTVDVGIDG